MTNPSKIAAGLSEAQRRALGRLADLGTNPYGHTSTEIQNTTGTLNALCLKGLAVKSRVYAGPLAFNITPLGLEVRRYLQEQDHDR